MKEVLKNLLMGIFAFILFALFILYGIGVYIYIYGG